MTQRHFKRLLRLDHAETDRLSRELDQAAASGPPASGREYPRKSYRAIDIALCVQQPGGGESCFLVTARNLSSGGISIFHGGFLYENSTCRVLLRREDGSYLTIGATVRHCRFLTGTCHEVGLEFERKLSDDELEEQLRRVAEAEEAPDTPTIAGHVLVAESFGLERQLLCQQLEPAGLELSTTDTAGKMLEELKKPDFDLVVCAFGTAEQGLRTIQIVRQLGCEIPIILLTGGDDPATPTAAIKSGVTQIMEKPVDADTLVGCIRLHLDPDAELRRTTSLFAGKAGLDQLAASYGRLLPEIANEIERSAGEGNSAAVIELCARVKGSAVGFGYPDLSAAAAVALAAMHTQSAERNAAVRRLIDWCRAVDGDDAAAAA